MEHIAFIITLGLLCCNKKTVEIYASAAIGLTVLGDRRYTGIWAFILAIHPVLYEIAIMLKGKNSRKLAMKLVISEL
ncbi:hypothetical protein Q5O89_22385 [Peribacillus frigoritolerans]|nr:hypothetical protein [Peribacillus frigoritolerans]